MNEELTPYEIKVLKAMTVMGDHPSQIGGRVWSRKKNGRHYKGQALAWMAGRFIYSLKQKGMVRVTIMGDSLRMGISPKGQEYLAALKEK